MNTEPNDDIFEDDTEGYDLIDILERGVLSDDCPLHDDYSENSQP